MMTDRSLGKGDTCKFWTTLDELLDKLFESESPHLPYIGI